MSNSNNDIGWSHRVRTPNTVKKRKRAYEQGKGTRLSYHGVHRFPTKHSTNYAYNYKNNNNGRIVTFSKHYSHPQYSPHSTSNSNVDETPFRPSTRKTVTRRVPENNRAHRDMIRSRNQYAFMRDTLRRMAPKNIEPVHFNNALPEGEIVYGSNNNYNANNEESSNSNNDNPAVTLFPNYRNRATHKKHKTHLKH